MARASRAVALGARATATVWRGGCARTAEGPARRWLYSAATRSPESGLARGQPPAVGSALKDGFSGAALELSNSSRTYGSVPTSELLRSLAVLRCAQSPWIVRYGPMLYAAAQRLSLTRAAANISAKHTFFGHFCGGETLDECHAFSERLRANGVECIFDYSAEDAPDGPAAATPPTAAALDGDAGEAALRAERGLDESAALICRTVQWMHERELSGFACFKLSALAPTALLQRIGETIRHDGDGLEADILRAVKHFEKGDLSLLLPAASDAERGEFSRVMRRLHDICALATRLDVPLLIDAEHFAVQGAIDVFAMLMQLRYNRRRTAATAAAAESAPTSPTSSSPPPRACIYTTVQAYLSSSPRRVEVLRSLCRERGVELGVKLVRGAYMSSERESARSRGYATPILPSAEATHENYDALLTRLLGDVADGSAQLMLATHNVASLEHASRECARLGVSRSSPRLHMAQLYGMGDSLTMGLVHAGFRAAKYVPFGPINKVLPYLIRRLEENHDALGGAPRDMRMFVEELRRRDLFKLL